MIFGLFLDGEVEIDEWVLLRRSAITFPVLFLATSQSVLVVLVRDERSSQVE